jgi:non-specific protein-tyrosine kinase
VLRTKVLKLTKEKGWNTIMVTSALPGDGKTLTAINLSLTFAREFNHTVLLVDCDLRKQNVHEVLGIHSRKGLIDYLLNDVPMTEIMIWPGIEKFTLISGGRTVHDSAELLGSPKMKDLFWEMKTRYPDRYIFFDVPPLLSVSDAMTFATLVDGILFVVEAGKTPMEDVERAIEMIPKEKFLGFVVNRKKEHLRDYDAKAYYGYPLKPAL